MPRCKQYRTRRDYRNRLDADGAKSAVQNLAEARGLAAGSSQTLIRRSTSRAGATPARIIFIFIQHMSGAMITEQEARDASARLKGDAANTRAARLLIMFARQELERREAEQAKRKKPIDDEWFWTVTRGRKDIGPQCRDTGDVLVRETIVKAVKTRGQLLDLLAALKGGAS